MVRDIAIVTGRRTTRRRRYRGLQVRLNRSRRSRGTTT